MSALIVWSKRLGYVSLSLLNAKMAEGKSKEYKLGLFATTKIIVFLLIYYYLLMLVLLL